MNIPSLWRGLPAVHTSRLCARRYHAQKGPAGASSPSHGEKIWVFNHWTSGQIVYSLKPVLDSNKAMRQLPFNGKKTKPAKLRKDYWRPMAVICFRPNFGRGVVGRSVFQMLREFRKLHELAWGDELLKSRKERGALLNDQRKNAIADMAAVLAGRGRGNRICEANNPPPKPWLQKPAANSRRLYKATILWANKSDRMYAREWTGNVTHDIMREWYKGKCLSDPSPGKPKGPEKADKTQEERNVKNNVEEEGKKNKNIDARDQEMADETVQEKGAPAVERKDTKEPGATVIPAVSVSDDRESEAAALIAFAHEIETEAKRLEWENDPDRDLWSPKDKDEGEAKDMVPVAGKPGDGKKQKYKAEA